MDVPSARNEKRGPAANDPHALPTIAALWRYLAPAATVGIFLMLLIAGLYLGHTLLMPITVGLVVGMTLAPVVKWMARRGVSSWITGPFLVLLLFGVIVAGMTLIAVPASEWIARAPEIGATVRQKLYVLDQPLAALRALQDALLPADGDAVKVSPANSNVVVPLVALLTPAIGQIVIFFGVLIFYLIGQTELRNHFVRVFERREAKLRFLKIVNEIEYNLTSYLTTVTIINVTLGIVVALGAWLLGLPNPIIFGVLATVLNYVPYIGPAVMLFILFAVGLVTFSTLGYSLLPPLAFLALATLEGQFVTPTIMGRRLTLNPLVIFLALAFWTWLWGPLGAFLAVPLSIIGLTIMAHLVPDSGKLPE